MSDIERWNARYGIAGQVAFTRGKGDMPVVEVNNGLALASIALQGAHVLRFQAAGQEPMIWMSDDAVFGAGKSLRGGVPVCWPWFGSHAFDSSLPSHGPARTSDWKPVAVQAKDDGSTQLSLELVQTDKIRQQCGHPLSVQLHVTVGSSLTLALETTNLGSEPFTLGEALHTYFLVGDVRHAHIEGLDGCEFIDKVDGGETKQQRGVVGIDAETDRIYLRTGSNCRIIDPIMGRAIDIRSEGSASVVVWNPWIETAAKMGDLGKDGYLHMLCVETTNAATDMVQLAAGASHRLAAAYSSTAVSYLIHQ